MNKFILSDNYQPCGDQPQAIDKLVEGVKDGLRMQVLLGVTEVVRPSLWRMS